MEHEASLPHSQAPAICLYPELAQSSPFLFNAERLLKTSRSEPV
jgi:hypothetical protein